MPTGAACQLTVDTTGIVPFRAKHVEAACLSHVRVGLDIRAAARHVGRDRYAATLTGQGNNLSLALVLAGVSLLLSYRFRVSPIVVLGLAALAGFFWRAPEQA